MTDLTTIDAFRRLQWWARSFRGVQPRMSVGINPPTITVGNNISTLNGNTNQTVSAAWNSGKISLAGPIFANDPGSGAAIALTTTLSDDSVIQGEIQHARFITDAPAFEVPLRGDWSRLNVIVDGQILARDPGPIYIPADAVYRQIKVDFGNDTQALYLAAATVSSGGTSYAVGDTITLGGGTGTPAVLTVLQIGTGGKINQVDVLQGGAYSAVPSGTIPQASSSGSGAGATFGVTAWAQRQSVRKARHIELTWTRGNVTNKQGLFGINVAATDTVQPWPVSPRIPTMLCVGDSQENTFVEYAGGQTCASLSQHLGLWENLILSSQGGTGYMKDNGTSLRWTDSRRIADIVRQNPDIVLITGGQNDGAISASILTPAITGMLNTLLALLPNTVFVGIGPVTANAALSNIIKAGWVAASDQRRVRYIDNYTVPWITGTGSVVAPAGNGNADRYLSSDGAHLTQAGHDWWAEVAAPLVGKAIVDMVTAMSS